jgi:hypothetical protein
MKLHSVTLCLDGMPWLAKHLATLEASGLDWTWHIVHGAAANTGSTKWCKMQMPRFSIDGSAEYINSLLPHPRVRIYQRQWWPGGKDQMLNAALPNESCVLMQIDADEIWTAEQLREIVKTFSENPTISAMKFWCRYFLGPRIIEISKDGYGNREPQGWRAWRFEPGMKWDSHEPPVLAGNKGSHIISREETGAMGLVFDHFAYATEAQVAYKERFYGYKDAVKQWRKLQANTVWPTPLKPFFPWAGESAVADVLKSVGPTLTVLGLTQHSAKTIEGLLESIAVLITNFSSVNYVMACDDNDAPTIAKLDTWALKDPAHRRLLFLRPHPNGFRYKKMARLRNKLLQYYHAVLQPSDWVLIVDADIKEFHDRGGMSLLQTADPNVGAIATYGIADWERTKYSPAPPFVYENQKWTYFDLLAFENVNRERQLWKIKNGQYYSHGVTPAGTYLVERNIIPPPNSVTEVNSAFGPATFYRDSAIKDLFYNEESMQAEHHAFHHALRKRGFKILLAGNIFGLYD